MQSHSAEDAAPESDIRPPRRDARRAAGKSAGNTILRAGGIEKVLGTGVGEIRVLKGIDVELRAGELTLLMGPSGSGKTTLLSILGCILTPTSGALAIAGQSTAGLGPEGLADLRRRHVGFVFQSYNLFPTLTATQNIMLALDLRGITGADAAQYAARALAEVGLTHRAEAFPGQMSGGEKQRVAIARALAGSPSVILADEPTAALDSENGKGVMALLAEVAKDKSRAVLAVTHDHRTLAYADRIIRIEDGQIVADERAGNASEKGSNGHILEGDEANGRRFRRRSRI
ncbi:MAG: ABC transporter ATP-binding protein [Hyphomicrobiaceae bacterium]|nr:ABC transporter ATP-binding protein [Hyphomicrobiaceae bacterium]